MQFQIQRFLIFIICIAISLGGFAQNKSKKLSEQQKIKLLNAYIQKAQSDWKVPGLAIAVVKDGQVIHSKGYGFRTLGGTEKVDAQTLFGSMSTTKAMVAVGMGLLVDKGKVKWTDKVLQHLPDFKIADAYISKELTVKDLFTHNTGLGNADFLWAWTPELSSDKILERMQYAQPVYSFRGGYTYQNIMYLVAGKIIEKISEQPWEVYTEETIFKPLGMSNSFASLERSKAYSNRSKAHYKFAGKIEAIEEMSADPIAPAGAVWSNADDIGKWVNFLLNNVTINDQPFLKTETLATFFEPQIIVPKHQFYPTTALTKPHWTTYGLGWFQHDYRGEMLNFHTGSLAGRTAIIGLLRDHNVGVYIFGNLDHAEVRHALMYKVFDLFVFDDYKRDWSTEMLELYGGLQEKGEASIAKIKAKRVKTTKPSHSLENYAGKYSDNFYGTVEVKIENNQLVLYLSDAYYATLTHWHFDTFRARWYPKWAGESLVSFDLDALSGAVKSISFDNAMLVKTTD